MAQTVVITDDMDGSANAETIEFSFDGSAYTIDLSKKNRASFEKALKPYIAAARKDTGRSGASAPGRRRRTSKPATSTAAIRAWANENGISVSERGRIPATVIEQYEAAQ